MDSDLERKINLSPNGNPQRQLTLGYTKPTPDELPIVAGAKLPYFSFSSKPYLQLLKDCGVNIVQAMMPFNGRPNDIDCSHSDNYDIKGFKACNISPFEVSHYDENRGKYVETEFLREVGESLVAYSNFTNCERMIRKNFLTNHSLNYL